MKNRLFSLLSVVLIVIFFTIISGAYIANANDGVLGVTPDGVYPITQADIMMVSEEIHIDCTTGKVTCRFDFKNYGAAQRVTIGFPARLNTMLFDGELTTEDDITVHNFTARDKNGDIPVKLADSIPNPPIDEWNGREKYNKWYTFTVDFAENEEKTLYHTYDVQFSYFSTGDVYIGYVIETGALWSGPIGHSKVIFDFGNIPMYSIEQVYPNNFYRIEGNKLIFEKSEFTPDYNLTVVMNQSKYANSDWFDYYSAVPEAKENAMRKMELFKTPFETIRKESKKYYQLYKELISTDSISALYIKSALELPNGNEKPEIVECTVTKNEGKTWYFKIKGIDKDGDIVRQSAKIEGISKFEYFDDNGNINFLHDEKGFVGRSYLTIPEEVSEPTPFSITFSIHDSVGNSDSVTMMLTYTPDIQPEPEPSPIPEPSPTPEPAEEASDIGDIEKDVRETFNNLENSQNQKLIPTEEEFVTLLTAGVIFVLIICGLAIILLWIRKRNWGYLFYIVQLIFIAIGLSQFIELLNLRDMTDGVMSSEIISFKIGITAGFWALSMFSMLAGIMITGRDKRKTNS